MDKISPSILRYFKTNNIDIFKLSEEERNNKIKEYQSIKREKLRKKMNAYNTIYYQKNKDKYFKNYYETNFDSIAEKSRIRYKTKKEQLNSEK